MSRIVEAVAPARLGTSFRWLLAAAWTADIGDGFAISAGPLLIASQTHDPRLVALALLLQQLPYLLFGLFAGALSDRVNRRAIVVAVDGSRALVVAVDGSRALVVGLLSLAILTGHVNVGRQLPGHGRIRDRQPADRPSDRRGAVRGRDVGAVHRPGRARRRRRRAGLIANRWGVTGPFWFAFVGSVIFVVIIWPQLRHIAHDDNESLAAPIASGGGEDVTLRMADRPS